MFSTAIYESNKIAINLLLLRNVWSAASHTKVKIKNPLKQISENNTQNSLVHVK